MKKVLTVGFFLILSIGIFAQTKQNQSSMNSYDEMWKQVSKFEKDDLPKSATEIVDNILKKAVADKNTQQTIKSLVYKNKYKMQLDQSETNQVFSDLENLLNETSKAEDKALLHSILAEAYQRYYGANSWIINQRTELGDYVPDDIKEWSKNTFISKIFYHFDESVKDKTVLEKVKVESYKDLVEFGEDSRRIYPTLYDFLMKRAINFSQSFTTDLQKDLSKKGYTAKDMAVQAEDFVKLDFSGNNGLKTLSYTSEYLKYLMAKDMKETIVWTELGRNSYLISNSNSFRTEYSLDFLVGLEKKYQAYDFNVEVIDAIVTNINYTNNTFRYSGDPADQKQSEEKMTEAYDWCKKGIDKYPKYRRINLLKNKLNEMERPSAEIIGKGIYHPDNKSKTFTIKYKNLNKVTLNITDKKTKTVVKTLTVDLPVKTTYFTEEKEVTIDLDKVSNYSVSTVYDSPGTDKKVSTQNSFSFDISKLAYFARSAGENKYEFYVVDRQTGVPISNATVNIYDYKSSGSDKYTLIGTAKTNDQGIAEYTIVPKNKNSYNRYTYRVALSGDTPAEYNEMPYSYTYTDNFSNNIKKDYINIFTDRNIYRPGQTVYFKAVATMLVDEKNNTVIPNKNYKVELYNANGQVVSEKTLKTNEFGSIAGEFTIPQGGLTGNFYIKIGEYYSYFRVEEYKRPTFQVTFDKVTETYTFGDKVTIKGHAESFSGVKLQNATVNYSINRQSYFRWYYQAPEFIDQGEITTKDDGSFEITFTIPENDKRKGIIPLNSIFNFSINASVTDLNGETQEGNTSFMVGNVSMILSADIPDMLDKASKDSIYVTATNLNGEQIKADGTYKVYTVLANDSIGREIKSGRFSTTGSFDMMSQIRSLPSAKYQIAFESKDDKGRAVDYKTFFILYSNDDKKPPIETNEWLIKKKTDFNLKENAEIIFGVSDKNVTVLYEIMSGNKVLERQHLKLSNEIRTLKIPYKNEYGDQANLVLTYVINEKSYQQNINLTKTSEIKNLSLKFEVFRDKLRPGQQEEWRISVKDNEGKPAFAELLASMYDASLDKISYPAAWSFGSFYKGYVYSSPFNDGNSFDNVSGSASFRTDYLKIPSTQWDQLKWFGLDFYGNMYKSMRVRGGGAMIYGAAAPVAPEAMYDQAELSEDKNKVKESSTGALSLNKEAIQFTPPSITQDSKVDAGEGGAAPQIRSNFNETAFFYPQLKTNDKGETIISFAVPESNTTWNFRALAYDKSVNTGTLNATAVTRKELMVTPNMPRFVRQGDKTSISTKISNLSDAALGGKARIEFFDPLTDKPLDIKVDKYQDFNIEKDASTSVTWMFDIPSNIDMIGCRIIAESATFSDGEQHVVSVLPNRMLVTESMTMNINGKQTKNWVFDKFVNNNSSSLSNYRLTLEYAGNPAWYAVQALPTLSNPTNENTVNWFASYYVNTLGSFIVQQYPKVNAMISAWKKQGGDKETLVSKLQKNEELKAVLLEETPWVLDAKDETEQMNRLSMLFDLNNTKMQTDKAVEKLLDLQTEDGGWAWYKGMHPSRSVTQYVLYGFTELIQLNAVQYPYEIKAAQMKAINFIDKQILSDYNNLKKNNKDWQKITTISTNQLEYLYVRSSYRDIPINAETREAERFYTSVIEKNWTKLNLYERSLLAVLAQRNGKKELTGKITKSMKENSTSNEEMGMFWANNRSSAFLSQSAVTVHTFVMNAFRETKTSSTSEMDMMKQWLLKQKQTQVWESTHATIDAIFALLSNGTDWLASTGESVVKLDNKVVEPENKELGTGYFKESWTGSDISKDMGKVSITKSDEGPAWGTLYWQYYEDLDKITAQKGELNVDKKMFIEKVTDKGKILWDVYEYKQPKVGDKVIMRLTVRVDRDMEFVHLKDMRASCFEPIETLSGIRWQNGTYYYQSTKDASTNFYFDHLAKGTYVFEYPVYANRSGEYSNGITTIQCMYAPEFVSHTSGIKVTVK